MTRLRHPPGGEKNLTNVNFNRTHESRARGNAAAIPSRVREAMGTADEQTPIREMVSSVLLILVLLERFPLTVRTTPSALPTPVRSDSSQAP